MQSSASAISRARRPRQRPNRHLHHVSELFVRQVLQFAHADERIEAPRGRRRVDQGMTMQPQVHRGYTSDMVVGRTPSANRSRGAAMVAGLSHAVLRRSQMDGRRSASHLAVHAQQSAARLARTRLRAAACLRTHRRDRSDDRCADRASPMGPEANDDRRLAGDWDVSGNRWIRQEPIAAAEADLVRCGVRRQLANDAASEAKPPTRDTGTSPTSFSQAGQRRRIR